MIRKTWLRPGYNDRPSGGGIHNSTRVYGLLDADGCGLTLEVATRVIPGVPYDPSDVPRAVDLTVCTSFLTSAEDLRLGRVPSHECPLAAGRRCSTFWTTALIADKWYAAHADPTLAAEGEQGPGFWLDLEELAAEKFKAARTARAALRRRCPKCEGRGTLGPRSRVVRWFLGGAR
jgi:hypothetical protein